jgi:prevent-host-death family protein
MPPYTTITMTELRRDWHAIARHVAETKERILVTRRGVPVFHLVPIEDLELLEELDRNAQ